MEQVMTGPIFGVIAMCAVLFLFALLNMKGE